MALVPFKKQRKNTASSSAPLEFSDPPEFRNKIHSDRYDELKSTKTVVPTPCIDGDTLKNLGIYEEVKNLLIVSGLRIFLKDEEFETFAVPTLEFVSSFQQYNENGVEGWKFQLGNRVFKRSLGYFRDLFCFPSGVALKEYSVAEKDAFWLEISGMPHFCPLMLHSNIKSGVWKYMHRIIASGINTRKDRDRFVNGYDMNHMMMIREGLPVDWLFVLGTMFEDWQGEDSDNKAIGGGYFVTMIARDLGFDMSTAGWALIKVLDTKQLVIGKDLKADRRTWNHDPEMTDRARKTIESRLRNEEKRAKRGKGKGKGKRAAEPEMEGEEAFPEHDRAPEPDFTSSARHSIEQQLIILGDRMTTLEVDHAVFSGRTNNTLTRMEDKLDWLIERSPGYDASAPHPRSYYGSSSGHRD